MNTMSDRAGVSRDELARTLCTMMQQRRLRRIGTEPPADSVAFQDLPESDQRNWLDMADCILELHGVPPTAQLRTQLADFERYWTTLAADKDWRDEMLRSMIIEMRVELDRLAREVENP